MESKTAEYQGFQIVVTPIKDHEDLWDFTYQISRTGDSRVMLSSDPTTRSRTLGGYLTAEIACDAGIELAKTEIDNHIALSKK